MTLPEFLAVATGDYVPLAQTLVRSIERRVPGARMRVHLINASDEQAASLADTSLVLRVDREERSFEDAETRRTYAANRRVQLIRDALQDGERSVLYLDVDSIVRKSLDALVRWMLHYDIVVLPRFDAENERARFLISTLGVNNTPEALRFLDTWLRELDDSTGWLTDQLTMWRAYQIHRDELSMGALPQAFVDWEMRATSPIWCGKGTRSHSNPLYRLEEEYLSQVPGTWTRVQLANRAATTWQRARLWAGNRKLLRKEYQQIRSAWRGTLLPRPSGSRQEPGHSDRMLGSIDAD